MRCGSITPPAYDAGLLDSAPNGDPGRRVAEYRSSRFSTGRRGRHHVRRLRTSRGTRPVRANGRSTARTCRRAARRIVQHIVTTSMPKGMRRVFTELGTPLETLDARFVNGQFYSRLRPLISPDKPAEEAAAGVRAEDRHPAASRDATPRARRPAECWQPSRGPRSSTSGTTAARRRSRRGTSSCRTSTSTRSTTTALLAHVNECIDHCVDELGAPLLAARLRPRADRHVPVRGRRVGSDARRAAAVAGRRVAVDQRAGASAGRAASTPSRRSGRVADHARRAARDCRRRSRRRSTTSCATAARCCSRATTSTASRWANVPTWCSRSS